MAIPYPDWLPLAQKSDKSPATDTGFRTDQPLVGAPIFQKLTDDLKTSFSLKWIFTFTQHRAFMQWLRSPNYLDNCNQWFSMRLNNGTGDTGLEVQELHFTISHYRIHGLDTSTIRLMMKTSHSVTA